MNCYVFLFILAIMTNNEFMENAKVNKSIFYNMKNGQNVTTDVLLRICNVLDCDIEEMGCGQRLVLILGL